MKRFYSFKLKGNRRLKESLLFIAAGIFLLNFYGCNKNLGNADNSKIVLEGYLFQGEVVDSVHITKTVSFESSDTVYPPVSDAQVVITWNNKPFTLQSIGKGYYNCNDNNLKIKVGDTYAIAVNYKGTTATSSTVIPSIPTGINLSDNVLYVDTAFSFNQFGGNQGSGIPGLGNPGIGNSIEISWNNSDNSYYYIVLESMDPNAADITIGNGNFPIGGFAGPGRIFRFRSQPFRGGTYTVSSRSMAKYGKHKAKIYKVNQEYADLYNNRQQDSRNLSEPITNIINGLGIFTGFSYAEVTFTVSKR
ncbi:MAG: DUF4249 family protein [Prolixibacteraceae bacterium]